MMALRQKTATGYACLGVLLQLPVRRQNPSQQVQLEGLSDAKMLHNSLYPFKEAFTTLESYYCSNDLLIYHDACHIKS